MDKSLSGEEVLKICHGKANILKYSDLKKIRRIQDCFRFGACILLYEYKPNYGHWCCIFENQNGIEFFDPYGYIPDDELEFVPSFIKIPYLTKLLYQSNRNIEYNADRLQEDKEGINTCGRHVGMRLLLRMVPIDDYVKIFGSPCDEIIYKLTSDI